MVGAPIRFGPYAFDAGTGVLRREGERCDLQSQPAQLLGLLLEQPGEVVTRERIRERLWPDTQVAYDQGINFAIRQIRLALGRDADLVQTVPRRGYRFIGEIAHAESPRPVTKPWRTVVLGVSRMRVALAFALLVTLVSGFGAGIVMRDGPAGQFVYDHLVHPDRCPYVQTLSRFLAPHPNS